MKLQHIIITSLIACVAACCALGLEAQNKFEVRKVDFDKIKKITQDPKARFYYPKLIQQPQWRAPRQPLGCSRVTVEFSARHCLKCAQSRQPTKRASTLSVVWLGRCLSLT